MEGIQSAKDPCALNKEAPFTFLWAFLAIIFGASLAYKLHNIDGYLYKTDAEVLDMKEYRDNRVAQSSIKVDSIDSRRFAAPKE